MSSKNPGLGTRMAGVKARHTRLMLWIKLLAAFLILIALLLRLPMVAELMTVLLIGLLLLPLLAQEPPAPTKAAAPPRRVSPAADMASQLAASMSISQVASIVLKAALRITNAEAASLALPAEIDHFVIMQLQLGQDGVQIMHRAPTGETLEEQVIRRGRAMFNHDRTELAVALCHEYLVIGALCVENAKQPFSQSQADSLAQIGIPAAVSLHHARLLEDLQNQIDSLGHLQALTIRLAGAVDSEAVAQSVLETARDLLGVQEVALYRRKGKRLELMLSLHRDYFNKTAHEQRLTRAIAVKAGNLGKVQIVHKPVTSIGVPVERGGAVTEVIGAAFIEHHVLRERDLKTLKLLAAQAAAHLDTVAQHEQVRAVSERLHVTLHSARDAVLLFDRNGKLLDCNPSAERLLGINRETFVGKHFAAMLFEMMKTNELNGLGYSRSQLTELARQLRLEPDQVTRRQFEQINDGQKLTIEEIGSPIIDANHQVIGRLLVLRDMTDQKLLADFRDEIMHMAVHDLRGPLSAVINGIDMTLKQGLAEYPEDNERVLKLSLESARGLMRLINTLLDIAKLESRRIPIKPQTISIVSLVDSACKSLESSIAQANIQVDVLLPPDLPPLLVDQDLIRRVLVNLIDNALRFTPQGARVVIGSAGTEEKTLTISIADSGPGIPPEERERIFERFRQSDTSKALRGSQGTGLGLTFCKLAVEAHGGKIWVEAAESLPGACFKLSLPVATPISAIY